MLQPLKPDPDQFLKAYPEWIRKTAQLIASSAEGTTIGIFGLWGSGKTSATLALKNAVLQAARGACNLPIPLPSPMWIAHLWCLRLQQR